VGPPGIKKDMFNRRGEANARERGGNRDPEEKLCATGRIKKNGGQNFRANTRNRPGCEKKMRQVETKGVGKAKRWLLQKFPRAKKISTNRNKGGEIKKERLESRLGRERI